MTTTDFIAALRAEIKAELLAELLEELRPEIRRSLFGNNFTISQTAEYLGVSESTVRRMINDGEIPHFKIRGQLFTRQTDLDAHINGLIRRKVAGQ